MATTRSRVPGTTRPRKKGPAAKPPVAPEVTMFPVPGPLVQVLLNIVAGLPYNQPAGEGLVCGDVVNALRNLKPDVPLEVANAAPEA